MFTKERSRSLVTEVRYPSTEPRREPVKVYELPVEVIVPNPYQPRKDFNPGLLEELTASIRAYGVLQPVTVRPGKAPGTYELIAGERRLRASREAGLSTIPARVIDAYEQDAAMIALIENLQREDLSYLEEADGYERLIKEHHLTQDELAQRMGKNQSTVANKLRLLKLPTSIKTVLVEHQLTERHARALLRLPSEASQLQVIKVVAAKGFNVRRTEELIEAVLKKQMQEQRVRNTTFHRDYRLYVNTFKRDIKMLQGAGVEVLCQQTEHDDRVVLEITIPKAYESK